MSNPQDARPRIISLTHDQEPVQVAAPQEPKKSYKSVKIIAAFLILFLVIGGGYLFFWPRAQTVMFASKSRGSVSNLFVEMDSVNDSLTSLFNFTTGSDQTDAQLSSLSTTFSIFNFTLTQTIEDEPEKEKMLGNDIGLRLNDLIKDLESVFKDLEIKDKGKVSFGGNVQGFTTPADDPNKIYRDQRDIAASILSSVQKSETSAMQLEEDLADQSIPNSQKSLKQDLIELKSNSKEYLVEAQKTADYYILTSDLSIELEGNFDSFQLSLQSSNSIDSLADSFGDISKDLKSLRNELEELNKEKLPSDIDNLHKDSIELFSIVIKYFEELKVLTLSENSKGIVKLTNNTSSELNQILLKGGDHELSFWKNNETLNSYGSLSTSHTEMLNKLEEQEDNNDIFIFRAIGLK